MMKRNGKRRVLSLLLCAAMLLSLVPVLTATGDPAEAKTSLPGIEAMKTAKTTLNILEIAPSADQGSIGYYIAGQEPCANWAAIAKGNDASARRSYVNGLFNGLASAGLLSSGTGTPLKAVYSSGSSYYDEKYPWESHTDYTPMKLTSPDSVSVKGSYTEQANGGYNLVSGFTLVANDSGTYNQKIAYYTTGTTGSEQYYYDPTFTKIEANAIDDVASGTPVYTNSAGNTPDYDKYVYVGTVGPSFILHYDPNTTYYTVTNTGTPAQTKTDTHYYVGVVDSYVAVTATAGTAGYFNPAAPVLQYVGDNSGAYSFTADSNGSTVTIKTSTVWYKGGFTNNDWFLRHVFDYDEAELAAAKEAVKFKVTTETPDAVTTAQVDSAGLIVLSNGFVPGGTASAYTTAMGNTPADYICAAVKKETAADTVYGKPVIVDHRLTALNGTNDTNLKGLATTLEGYAKTGKTLPENTTSWVGGSVYVFNPDDTRLALATKEFATVFADATLYNSSTAPFGEVWDDIGYENFLRKNKDSATTDLLPETVSMAACVRYIISFNAKSGGTKDTLNVLDIEPGSGTMPREGTNSDSTSVVLKWLGYTDAQIADANYAKPTVTITTMSTAEFNSKIDNLTETYDLIYVGSNNAYKSNHNDISKINDILGGSFLYANIGKKVNINRDTGNAKYMSGLLDSDTGGTGMTFRYPGNDLTAAKLSALTDYAGAGYPVVVSDELVSGGSEGTSAFSFTVEVSAGTADNSSVPLTAKAVATAGSLPAGLTPSYQWYRYTGQSGNTTKVISSASCNAKSGTYFCEIIYTVGGKDYTARSADVTVKNGTVYTPNLSEYYTSRSGRIEYASTHYSFFSANATASGTTLSVSPSIDEFYPNTKDRDPDYDSIKNVTYSYQWYCHYWSWSDDYGIPGATGSSLSLDSPLTSNWPYYYYYCVVSVSILTYQNDNYSVSSGTLSNAASAYSTYYYFTSKSGLTAAVGTGATTTQVPAQAGIAYTLNTDTVDCNSRVYSLLDTIKSKPNVTKVSAVSGTAATLSAQTALRRYANLSKPAITLTTQPASYYKDKLTTDCGNTLSYTFTIANSTDPDRGKTNYRCNLYIDANGDGLYKSDELFSDLVVTQGGATVANGQLKAGKTYSVSRQLLDDQVGILPWKLEVVALDSSGKATTVTASAIGYTHRPPVEGQIKTIKILQINDVGNQDNCLSLQDQTSTDGGSTDYSGYKGIYGKLFYDVRADFQVAITTKTIADINSKNQLNHNTAADKVLNIQKDSDSKTYDNLKEYFNSFDMLVLGFRDFYGGHGSDLSAASAIAVRDYIATGKAVLFTHDCTSYYNQSGKTGYNFNNILRNTVGLDLYGVTSPQYGITSKASTDITVLRTGTNYVANAYKASSDANAVQASNSVLQGIKDAGYSVAYEPGKAGVTTKETQGYTQGQIDRMLYANDSNIKTRRVSQVNKGQITTYPYDINTTSFTDSSASESGLGSDRLTIAATHFQYYQLNMNEAHTVVWYCLSYDADTKSDYYSNNSAALYNDGSNTYYIYSKGNVTYSGAGHYGIEENSNTTTTVNDPVNINEAKLFVNTMIAAYRVAKVQPTTGFTTDDKTTVTTDYVVPYDGDALTSDGQKVWFKITDNNIGAGKLVQAIFTKTEGLPLDGSPAVAFPTDSTFKSPITVYDADGNPATTLVTGSYYVKLSDLQGKLSLADGQTAYLTVKTTFANDKTGVSSKAADLHIKPFNLFDLN